jgi:hypothetical protein
LWSFITVTAPNGGEPNVPSDPNSQKPPPDANDGSGNVLPDEVIPPACGAGACGAGYVQLMPLTLAGVLGMKRRRHAR